MSAAHQRRWQRWGGWALCALILLGGCARGEVDVHVAQVTPDEGNPTPDPFPFEAVEAAYLGVSGAYPYMILYEDGFSCSDLTEDGGAGIVDVTYDNILILVGGWEEGSYPIFDVLGSTGAYSLDGQAIAYFANRTGRTINELEYAVGGTLEVERISEIFQTVRGSFHLEFESGTLSGDFVIGDYCDVY